MKKLLILGFSLNQLAWGWGELGHSLIAKSAAELLAQHPLIQEELQKAGPPNEALQAFINVFQAKHFQQGHLANIPDTHWRNLDGGLEEEGSLLGGPPHYLDSEILLKLNKASDFFKRKIPLDYEEAKNTLGRPNLKFFSEAGSLPWRAQQFSSLYSQALNSYPKAGCSELNSDQPPTRVATAYAGLMSHYTGDASMPLHSSIDYDGIAIGQKGIHVYFENDLVNALELSGLYPKVFELATQLLKQSGFIEGIPTIEALRSQSKELYPAMKTDQETTAVMISLLGNSYAAIETLRQLDYVYSLATLEEALEMPQCQSLPVTRSLKTQLDKFESAAQKKIFLKVKVLSEPSQHHDTKKAVACRRKPSTRLNKDGELASDGKTVAEWHQSLIVGRLALSTALTADIWARSWLQSSRPKLCPTWKYALKPSFVSPTDPACFGYALKENPNDFIKKRGGSALPWKQGSKNGAECVTF